MTKTLAVEAVRKTVTVDCTVEEAFRTFTVEARSWWPTSTHSIHHEKVKDVVFEEREGGEVYELSEDGQRAHWATVVSFDPPNRVVLAWNISEADAVATEVEVRFTAEGDGTRVDLEHRGWDALPERAAERRSSYDTGWIFVLGEFAKEAAGV